MFCRSLCKRIVVGRCLATSSTATKSKTFSMFNPSEEHQALRQMLRNFVETEVDPQAKEFNKAEKFNMPLYKRLGELGLLGVTVPVEYGGSGMDATAGMYTLYIGNDCKCHNYSNYRPRGIGFIRSSILSVLFGALDAVCKQFSPKWESRTKTQIFAWGLRWQFNRRHVHVRRTCGCYLLYVS